VEVLLIAVCVLNTVFQAEWSCFSFEDNGLDLLTEKTLSWPRLEKKYPPNIRERPGLDVRLCAYIESIRTTRTHVALE
jgi:hypothetical protein